MLSHYKLIAQSLVQLLQPLIEVVIHDCQTNTIVFISGLPSLRKVGDPSGLTKKERQLKEGILGPYLKHSPNGALQKAVSVVLEQDKRYMLCINFAVGEFKEMEVFLRNFLNLQATQAQDSIFEDNWQDHIHTYIANYLSAHNQTISQLSRQDKQTLVLHLDAKGAFQKKNAASYIGRILKISRASVYSYLKKK